MNKSFLERYLKRPFKLLLNNWSIVLLFFVFLILANFIDKYSDFEASLSSTAVFGAVHSLFITILHSPTILSIIIIGFLIKSYLIVGMGQDMMNIFSSNRKSLFTSLKDISWSTFWWFLKNELLIYIVFNAIAITFYTFCYWLWMKTGLETLPMIILFGGFVFFYPLFYFSFSFISMICPFPIGDKERFNKIHYFIPWVNLKKTYIFYAIRLSFEYLFLFILPYISLVVFKNHFFAKLFAIVGLLLPLLLLRGSAYIFKLRIMKEDSDIKRLFPEDVTI